MALSSSGANTDRVDIGSAASLQGFTTATILGWFKPTALASSRYVFGGRYQAGGTSVIQIQMNDTSGNIRLIVLGTSNMDYRGNTRPFSNGAWNFLAVTFVFGTSAHIYTGTLTSAAAECGYSVNANGATQNAETGGSALWANRNISSAPGSTSFPGSWAWGMIYNRALSLGEIQALQYRPRVLSGCVNYIQFGFAGTSTQPDWSGSGNAGTVTGAAVADHLPLGPFFATDRWVPYAVVSTTGHLLRNSPLNGIAGTGQQCFNPSLAGV